MLNIHVLDEGIDIPECDSIFLTNPNNNYINIIQRISRANRIDENNINKIANIFVWCKNEDKYSQIYNLINNYILINHNSNNISNNSIYIKTSHNKVDNIDNIDNIDNRDNIVNSNTIKIDENITDELREIINICSNDNINDFVIDLDNVTKWLKTQKKHIKKTLIETYTRDVDYKVKLRQSTGGRPSEDVLLTQNCFKRLCMLSRTTQAENIRNHLIKYGSFVKL
jgi:hypothetical protein